MTVQSKSHFWDRFGITVQPVILQVIEEGPEPRPRLEGKKRVYRVWLDTNQYQSDMGRLVEGAEDVYETFNVFVRRKPKENNFKVHNSLFLL